jgi:hypothetical protein
LPAITKRFSSALSDIGGTKRRAKHAAPGQYLGFALQPVRLCYHLLTCPDGARVSLEHVDDVGVHAVDGSTIVEQAKSALSQNPVSDWADDFWKCLANWLDCVEENVYPVEKSQFRLYVTPSRKGIFSQALNTAESHAEIEIVVSKIRQSLDKRKKAPTCLPFLRRFLDATADERVAVVSRFKIISTDADPVQPLRDLLAPTVQPSLIDPLCQYAIGKAKETADALIRSGAVAMLHADIFKSEFRLFVQKNNLPGMLMSLAPQPQEGAVVSLLASGPTFIKQLDLIQVTDSERIRAVSDFLRSSADKSSWADAGLVFEQGLRDWDAELIRRHGLVCGEVSDIHAEREPPVRGRIVYRQCAQLEPPLDGRVVPGHFVHGCLNYLADIKEIGWHPDYKQLLGDVRE